MGYRSARVVRTHSNKSLHDLKTPRASKFMVAFSSASHSSVSTRCDSKGEQPVQHNSAWLMSLWLNVRLIRLKLSAWLRKRPMCSKSPSARLNASFHSNDELRNQAVDTCSSLLTIAVTACWTDGYKTLILICDVVWKLKNKREIHGWMTA